MFALWKKSYEKPRQCIKKQRHHFAGKGLYSQTYVFSSSHMWKGELDHKESWTRKKWFFQTVVLENTLESPLDSKNKPVNTKGNQPWIGRTDVEASNTLTTWFEELTHWKRPWCWERLKAKREGGNRGWDVHRLNGHELEQTPGDIGGQRSLACCSPWGHKMSITT